MPPSYMWTGEGNIFLLVVAFFLASAFLISMLFLGVFLRYLPGKAENKNNRLLLVGLISAIGASFNYLMMVGRYGDFWLELSYNATLFPKERWSMIHAEIHGILTYEYRFYLAIGLSALSATLIAISIKKQTQWKSIFIFYVWMIAGPLTAFLSVLCFYKISYGP